MSDSWSTYRLPLLMREPSGQSIAHLGGRSVDDSLVALARSYRPPFLAWSARDLFFGITANLEASEGSLGHQLIAVDGVKERTGTRHWYVNDGSSGNDQDYDRPNAFCECDIPAQWAASCLCTTVRALFR